MLAAVSRPALLVLLCPLATACRGERMTTSAPAAKKSRDVTTGEERLLTDGESRHGAFTLSRTGLTAFTNNARAPGDLDVYMSPARGKFSPSRLLARGGQWSAGAWSRDGRRLFVENTGEYRRDLRRAEYGDERDPETRAFLDRISPLSNAERIGTPLLIGHGANDPRVPLAEAEQIIRAVRENGVDVWYMLARDEGHGFRKRRSRDLFYSLMVMFFDEHLAGGEPEVSGE